MLPITLVLYFLDSQPETIAIEGDLPFSQIREILSNREVYEYEVSAGRYDITYDYLDWYCQNL